MPEPRQSRRLRGVLRIRVPGGVPDQVRQRHLWHGMYICVYVMYICMNTTPFTINVHRRLSMIMINVNNTS